MSRSPSFLLKDNTPPRKWPDAWYQVRKEDWRHAATLPQGVIGPFFNDEFGDVYGTIYALTAGGFSRKRVARQADRVRQQVLLQVRDVAKVEMFGVQAEGLTSRSRRSAWPDGPGLQPGDRQLNAQNAVEGGRPNAGTANLQIRVAGQFNSVQALETCRSAPSARNRQPGSSCAWATSPTIHRAYVDPPATMVRHQGKQVLAPASRWPRAATSSRWAAPWRRDRAIEPAAGRHRLDKIQDQPRPVSTSVNEFVVLIEAVVIVLAVSFISLGLHGVGRAAAFGASDIRPGLVVGITIPWCWR